MFGLLWDYVLSLGFRIVFNYYLRFLITLYLFLHDLNWNIQSHEVKIFWLDNGSLCLSIVCAVSRYWQVDFIFNIYFSQPQPGPVSSPSMVTDCPHFSSVYRGLPSRHHGPPVSGCADQSGEIISEFSTEIWRVFSVQFSVQ